MSQLTDLNASALIVGDTRIGRAYRLLVPGPGLPQSRISVPRSMPMAPSYTSSAMIVGCEFSEGVCRRGAFFNAVSCSAPTPKIEKFGQKSHEVGTGLAEGGRSSFCLRHEPSRQTMVTTLVAVWTRRQERSRALVALCISLCSGRRASRVLWRATNA